MDFYITGHLRFLIKLGMASQTSYLPELNGSQCCTQRFFGHDGTYIYRVGTRREAKALHYGLRLYQFFF